MDATIITGIIITLILSAFFSGVEIAYIASDKLFLELAIEKGSFFKKQLLPLIRNPSLFLATTLVGNTIALVAYGAFMARALDPVLMQHFDHTITLLLQTIISTIIVLATAEFTPKSVFLINPDKMILSLAVPFRIISTILYPLSWSTNQLSRITITKVFKAPYSAEESMYKISDLDNYLKSVVSESEDTALDIETEFLNNALEFKTIKVRECIVPRTDVTALSIDAEVEELKQLFVETGYSKILIYKQNIDDIIGYCHSANLFKKPQSISQILTKVDFVPETKLANELLVELISKRKSLAVIVDEFGGTSGIVTIEDIIEEIFGEIHDEHDDEELIEMKLDANNFLLSGRHHIDYLNDNFDLSLPHGDYDTLGGLVLSVLEDIPKEEDIVEQGRFVFTIKSMDGIKIERIKVTVRD